MNNFFFIYFQFKDQKYFYLSLILSFNIQLITSNVNTLYLYIHNNLPAHRFWTHRIRLPRQSALLSALKRAQARLFRVRFLWSDWARNRRKSGQKPRPSSPRCEQERDPHLPQAPCARLRKIVENRLFQQKKGLKFGRSAAEHPHAHEHLPGDPGLGRPPADAHVHLHGPVWVWGGRAVLVRVGAGWGHTGRVPGVRAADYRQDGGRGAAAGVRVRRCVGMCTFGVYSYI